MSCRSTTLEASHSGHLVRAEAMDSLGCCENRIVDQAQRVCLPEFDVGAAGQASPCRP